MISSTPEPQPLFDVLDRRIIGALQVNGRAGWRQIAAALNAPERTVAARGTEMLRSGKVYVSGFTLLPNGGVLDKGIISLRCKSGMNRVAATAAANRSDTVFTFLTTGEIDCVFEIIGDRARTPSVLLDELPAIPGVESIASATVIKHYKVTHQWRPLVESEPEILALSDPKQSWEPTGAVEMPPLSRDEQEIVRVLGIDGRATIEELARATALSPASARRRLAQLQSSGRVYIRTVVEPADIGFPVVAVLRIRAMPQHIDRVARILAEVPEIRYLAFVTGSYQLFAEIACVSQAALNDFLFRDDWTEHTLEIDTSIVIQAIKRSGKRRM